jgi:hypothetical protein
MDSGDSTTECGPPPLIYGESNGLMAVSEEMSAKNRTHACGFAGVLKLDDTVDSIGVGAGQRPEALTNGCLGEHLGAGDPDAEREVGVNVEVGKHQKRER